MSEHKKIWRMPPWMEKYRPHLFNGKRAEELMNGPRAIYQVNAPRATAELRHTLAESRLTLSEAMQREAELRAELENARSLSNDYNRGFNAGRREEAREIATLKAQLAEAERKCDLVERTAQIAAHRACCGTEHDPLNGKLHGCCIVCGVPWPCDYAGKLPAPVAPEAEQKPPCNTCRCEYDKIRPGCHCVCHD